METVSDFYRLHGQTTPKRDNSIYTVLATLPVA